MSNVIFYHTNDSNLKAQKSLTQIFSHSFTKKFPFDIENPQLTVRLDGLTDNEIKNINYAKIDNYFYFIDKKVEVMGGLYEFNLSCDYLSTSWNRLKVKTFLVERQEFKRNTSLVDSEILLQANNNFIGRIFGDSINSSSNYNTYITVSGGGRS